MSIYKNGHSVTLVQHGARAVMMIYRGSRLVWSKVASWWRGEMTWGGGNMW